MVTFLHYRDKVLNLFDECIHFAETSEFDELTKPMQAGKKRIEENKLVVLVCGEAKRGKSTLLAALLEDEELFPIDIEITTCLATIATWGDTEKITVTLEDGSEKLINRAEIPDYATEKRNTGNHQKAKWITVETPNPKLKDGLTFIDTPGVGSLNPQHTELTYNFLPRADIVLFTSDAMAPLTNPELTFLRGVRKYCENFLFIMTKKDLNAEYESIVNENIGKIDEFAGIEREKINYIPVSGTARLASLQNKSERMALLSNFEMLEETIWDMIAKNRAELIIAPPLGDLAAHLKTIEKEIHIKATGLSGSEQEQEELKTKLEELQKDRKKLLSDSDSWQKEIRRKIELIGDDQKKVIEVFKSEAHDVLKQYIENEEERSNPSLPVNEILLLARTTEQEMNEDVFVRLCDLKSEFEKTTKLNLYDDIVRMESSVSDEMLSTGAKTSIMGSVVDGVVDMTEDILDISSFSLKKIAFPLIAMPIVLGLGIATGGIPLVLASILGGGVIAGGVGAIGGLVSGLVDKKKDKAGILENNNTAHLEIASYIDKTAAAWENNIPVYLEDISVKFINSLLDSIKNSQKTIEKDISELQFTSELDSKQHDEELEKLRITKAGFSVILDMFEEIRSIKIDAAAEE